MIEENNPSDNCSSVNLFLDEAIFFLLHMIYFKISIG